MSDTNKIEKLTKRDVTIAWAKYLLSAEVISGFERLTAAAFSYGMGGILEKLYKDHPEEYKGALKRHLMFYNSEANFGSMIIGIAAALEEERAIQLENGAPQELLDSSSEMIVNLKLGLMGPLAGLGDTVLHAMLRPMLLSFFIPIAAAGNWIGGVAPLIIWTIVVGLFGYYLARLGYTSGRASITTMLESGAINKFINGASVLGLFMMGSLSAGYVNLTTPIEWTNAIGEVQSLQGYLDNLFPQLLPLLVVFGIYIFFKKIGQKYVTVLVTIIILSMVLSFLGIV